MLIIFRVDASQIIGSGHVMRCLTLAEELRNSSISVEFILRDHPGNMNEFIGSKGFKTHVLKQPYKPDLNLVGYESWLGVKHDIDIQETIQVIKNRGVDWLVIDHYALDYIWEKNLRPYVKKIMVIDDLANRKHDCDLLLDQNYTHDKNRYHGLLPFTTTKLLGPKYALLRKSFVKDVNDRTQNNMIKRVFVFFGGTDADNITAMAIKALSKPKLKHLLVDVVVGSTNIHQLSLKNEIEKHKNIELHVQVDNVAELMSKADIALGAGGSTTWERMVTGLPSIVITTAENQVEFTRDLDSDGYHNWLGCVDNITENEIYDAMLDAIRNSKQLCKQSLKCQQLVGVNGAKLVGDIIIKNVLSITIISDASSWMIPWVTVLLERWGSLGYLTKLVNTQEEIPAGDLCFILSCNEIIKPNILKRNKHNLVVHASDLPKGKGMSPLSWQILEGKSEIAVTLFEAEEALDAGNIYLQDFVKFKGHELLYELRTIVAEATIKLCCQFVNQYPLVLESARVQSGKESFYTKRRSQDSRLDITKSLLDQFSLLRIVDNERYPAFFELRGCKYKLKIEKY